MIPWACHGHCGLQMVQQRNGWRTDMAQEDQTASPVPTARHRKGDVERLHELGYAQELLRSMGGFSNFAVSFTIISILSGCLTLYGFGMNTGGPVVMSIGWPLVGIMVIFVGLAMAEIASSYPTSGWPSS